MTLIVTSCSYDVDAMCSWSVKWKLTLSFNAIKCKHVRFGTSSPHIPYSINGTPLELVFSYKDLGVTISSDLSFSVHIDSVLSKAYKSLGLIRRSLMSHDLPISC